MAEAGCSPLGASLSARLGLPGVQRNLRGLEGWHRTRTQHPNSLFSVNEGHSRRTPHLGSYSAIGTWMLCLQYTCRQPSVLSSVPSPAGQAQGLWKSVIRTQQTSGRAPSPEWQRSALSWTRRKAPWKVAPTPPPRVLLDATLSGAGMFL